MATQLVVVCAPATDGIPAAPCGVIAGAPYAPMVVEQPVLTASTVAAFEQATLPIDFEVAATFWAWAIGPILGLFLAGLAVGSIVKVVGDA